MRSRGAHAVVELRREREELKSGGADGGKEQWRGRVEERRSRGVVEHVEQRSGGVAVTGLLAC